MAKKDLFIIARRGPQTYATLKERFASHSDIDVILDRRHAQRRRTALPTETDRRVQERRSLKIDTVLRQLGWVVVERTNDPT